LTDTAEDPDCLDDGDGIPGGIDNCPSVYNPDQSNIDSQNGGDVCDICPADNTDTCDQNYATSGNVNASGGNITNSAGEVTIDIPSGAVDEDTSAQTSR